MINRFSFRQFLNVAGVAGVLLLSWYLYDSDDVAVQKAAQQDSGPDYQMKNFTTTTYAENGSIAFELVGTQLAHFNSVPDRAEIDAPTYIEYQDGVPQLRIFADFGVAINDSEIVELKRDVTLEKQSANDTKSTVVTTEYLKMLPDQHYAETDALVSIVGSDSQTHAIGMTIDTQHSIVNLLSDVQSVFSPQN